MRRPRRNNIFALLNYQSRCKLNFAAGNKWAGASGSSARLGSSSLSSARSAARPGQRGAKYVNKWPEQQIGRPTGHANLEGHSRWIWRRRPWREFLAAESMSDDSGRL